MFLAAGVLALSAVSWADDAPTSEQRYKNIQVLRGIPGEELIPAMDFIDGALGVQCSFCHGSGRFPEGYEKDDLAAKQTARKMMKMMREINQSSFGGRNVVTCSTCHNGHIRPQSNSPVGTEESLRQARPAASAGDAALPSADELFAKFDSAIGREADVSKLTSRHIVATATTSAGQTSKTEIFSKPPNLFLQEAGPRRFAYDGKQVWASVPSPRELTGADADSIRLPAQFYRNLRLRGFYAEARTLRKAGIGEKEAYVVRAALKLSRYTDVLWFDAESGLLLRRESLSRTVLGESTQVDEFANYREIGGIKVAMDTTRALPGLAPQKLHFDLVEFNLPIDDAKFSMPAK